MTHRILLVEDDPGLRLMLSHRLACEGYRVETAPDGEEGLRRATGERFDLVVLDVMLPGRSGFDVCRTMRFGGVETPVIMLTARGEVADRVTGLKLGADDYLTKPFEMAELLARVEARLRRDGGRPEAPAAYRFGSVEVDFRQTEVHRAGQRVESVGEGVPAAALSHLAPRRDPEPQRASRRGLGLRREPHHPDGRRPRRLAAAQAGRGPATAAAHPDGPRPRVQIRGLSPPTVR